MPKFSKTSARRLAKAHPLLQKLFNEAIKYIDFTILETERTPEQQALNVIKGSSWTLHSKHLKRPAEAVDAAFYPIDWSPEAWEQHLVFAGKIMGMALMLGIKIRWGGDWDRDENLAEERKRDLVHFEVIL